MVWGFICCADSFDLNPVDVVHVLIVVVIHLAHMSFLFFLSDFELLSQLSEVLLEFVGLFILLIHCIHLFIVCSSLFSHGHSKQVIFIIRVFCSLLRKPIVFVGEDAPKQVSVLLVSVECILVEKDLLSSFVESDVYSAWVLDLV